MKKYKNVSELLSELCLDERVSDGIFKIENNEHMEVLREKLSQMGLDEDNVREMTNKVLEGKYPERQAYNAKGILVTFPNPEYKKRAIQRGTHFEQDPTKGKPNINFGGDQPAPATPVKEPGAKQEPVQMEPSSDDKGASKAGSIFADEPAEPKKDATTAPTPSAKDDLKTRSPEEKEQDAQEVKKILTGTSDTPGTNQSAPTENVKVEFTIDEARDYGWIKEANTNRWYSSEGILKGHEWYCVESHQKKILSIR